MPLGHLMWHAWREVVGSAWLLVGAALFSLPVAVLVLEIASGVLHIGGEWPEPQTVGGVRFFPWFGLMPFVLVTGLVGSLVFRGDPAWGARFLAERGVSPRVLWVARQTVWGGWLVGLLVVAVCLVIAPGFMQPPTMSDAFGTLGNGQYDYFWATISNWQTERAIFRLTGTAVALNAFLAWAVLFSAFAAAQLVSLVVRRRLLAAVFSVVIGTIAAGWAYLMIAIDVPWWWSVLPLTAGCLLATWLRTPAWLLARTGWRGWILPAGAVVAPLALLAVAVPRYRVDEIPAVRLDWPAEDSSPAAIADVKAALALYQRAYDACLVLGDEPSDADRQATAELVFQASRYRSTWLPGNPRASWRVGMPIYYLAIWLSSWAEQCQSQGQLDKAMEAHLAMLRVANHFDECAGDLRLADNDSSIRSQALKGLRSWAAAGGQTPERLHEAIRQLDDLANARLSATVRLRSWYEAATVAITNYLGDIDRGYFTAECWVTSRLPWERERALRLERFITNAELDRIRTIELLFRAPGEIGESFTRIHGVGGTFQVRFQVRQEVGHLLAPMIQHAALGLESALYHFESFSRGNPMAADDAARNGAGIMARVDGLVPRCRRDRPAGNEDRLGAPGLEN